MAPVALEVAAQDGRQVRGGRPVARERTVGHGRSGAGSAATRVPRRRGPARPRTMRRHGRLHPDRREPARPAERAGLRRGRDPALHPRVGREGRGPSRGVREDGRAGLPRRADPRGVRRRPGWTTSASRILCEELERADTAFRVVQSVHVGLNSLALLQWGTEEQRQRWLVPQARGEKLATFGLTEPGVGTDAANLADDRPPRRRRLPAQRPEDLDLAWPTSPTTSSSSPRSTGRRSTRA